MVVTDPILEVEQRIARELRRMHAGGRASGRSGSWSAACCAGVSTDSP
jgi:hypothetical protein